ncbi:MULTISPECIES: hypothetical protein [Acidobacteriaceae]|uniref:hypothetical protein n=1 Tax=Acidobacteriaceae TaxID=204434 RepID=UPI00131B9D94|nr:MULTISPECIES: hypothetical protein [Acidobacteriaceae]MDW5267526.1 hypothetical protein [Edaphobacter sp.]
MDMPEDQYALYAEFGITAEKAQVLETEAGNVALSYVTLFVNTDEITPELTEIFRSVNDDVNRKTLGALLKHLKTRLNFDDSITNVIDEALKQRNYLTHHFFRTHNFALFSEDGRKLMLAELKEIQPILDKAHTTLHLICQILEQIAGREGLSNEQALHFQNSGKKVNI